MNKIEIFKPFGEAYALMKKILFQPFDLTKWLVIGFAAFLTHLGAGFNFNYRVNPRADWRETPELQGIRDAINAIPHPLLLAGIIVFALILIAT